MGLTNRQSNSLSSSSSVLKFDSLSRGFRFLEWSSKMLYHQTRKWTSVIHLSHPKGFIMLEKNLQLVQDFIDQSFVLIRRVYEDRPLIRLQLLSWVRAIHCHFYLCSKCSVFYWNDANQWLQSWYQWCQSHFLHPQKQFKELLCDLLWVQIQSFGLVVKLSIAKGAWE